MQIAITPLAYPQGVVNDELIQHRQLTGSPGKLRLDPAFDSVGLKGFVDDLSRAAQQRDASLPGLIVATPGGIIIAGMEHWWCAQCEGRAEISWIEYSIAEDDALEFILNHYQSTPGVNDFVRIRAALTREPGFQQKAQENMRAGGKYKGSTNLSTADHVEFRGRVADLAKTGLGNVDKVKAILRGSLPSVIAALENGTLSIHRAWLWSKLPKSQQKDEFARFEEKQTERIISREPRFEGSSPFTSSDEVIGTFRGREVGQLRSVASRISSGGRTRCQPWQSLFESQDP